MVVVFISAVTSQIVCPDRTAIAPCNCNDGGDNVGIELECFAKDLTDAQVSVILDTYLSTPGVSPLTYLMLRANQLTRIPSQVTSLPQLDRIELNFNKITTVATGSFNLKATLKWLFLENNLIATIEPGAFQGIRLIIKQSIVRLGLISL